MGKIDQQMELIQKWHLENYVHYERAFGRYLLVGGGASIGMILSLLKSHSSPYSGWMSFDTAVWLFTANIFLAGFSIYLNTQYAAQNAKNFSHLVGYSAGWGEENTSEKTEELFKIHDSNQTEVQRRWKFIQLVQALSALLFSFGFLVSIYLATKIL